MIGREWKKVASSGILCLRSEKECEGVESSGRVWEECEGRGSISHPRKEQGLNCGARANPL